MKKALYLFLFLSSAILFTACPPKEGEGEEKPVYYLNQMMKDYVIFPDGSWWVYEDSASGVVDTVTVTRSENSIVDREDISYIYEYQSIRYNSSYYNAEIIAGGGGQEGRYNESPPPTFIPTRMFFSSPEGDSIMLYSGYLVRSRLDSLQIKNTNYTEVLKFTTTKFQHNLVPEFTFYAPHVGLIRKQLFNGTIWNLKEYHINN